MLETLTWRQESRTIDWPEDAARIKAILEARGYTASDEDIARAWKSHSESLCATWLILPADDDDLFRLVLAEFANNSVHRRGM